MNDYQTHSSKVNADSRIIRGPKPAALPAPHSVTPTLWLAVGAAIAVITLFLSLALSPSLALAQGPCNRTETVVVGDTLREIANRCTTTVNDLLAANPEIRNPNLIYPGQLLTIPNQNDDQVDSSPDDSAVTVSPSTGEAGISVQLQAGGFPPNTPLEIGFGRVESEYDLIAQATADANGNLNRSVRVPNFADAGDRFVFVVLPRGSTVELFSNVFTVVDDRQIGVPQVVISPRSGPSGSNAQLAVSNFPGNTRISYGFGVPGGQLLDLFSARTNRDGSAQLTLQVPEVTVNTELEALAFVPYEGGANARSDRFTVTAWNEDGDNLFSRTNIYLIALEDGGRNGMEIGCDDSVVPVEVAIEPTIAPLTAALSTLFELDERMYGQSGLYNAFYQSDLLVDRIDIVDGIASLYLTGELRVGGVCDEPRIRAQLEETALQYSTVDEVRIYINGAPLTF